MGRIGIVLATVAVVAGALLTVLRQLGGDPADFLARLKISPDTVTERDAFIPLATYTLLLEVTAAELHCPDFGLRLSRFRGLDVLGPISVIVRNSETAMEAFEAAARFMYIHTPALKLRAELHDDGQMRVVYEVAGWPNRSSHTRCRPTRPRWVSPCASSITLQGPMSR